MQSLFIWNFNEIFMLMYYIIKVTEQIVNPIIVFAANFKVLKNESK